MASNLLSSLLSQITQGASGLLSSFQPSQASAYDPRKDPNQMKLTYGANATPLGGSPRPMVSATPMPTPTPSPMLSQPTRQGFSPDSIRQGIQSWTRGNQTPVPILNNVEELYQAGLKLPQNVDPYIPTILALRETQGGRDNVKPGAKTGKNNYYNIRYNGEWINYPDVKTAILGGKNPLYGGIESGGVVGQLNGPIYEQFRKTGNVADLWQKWSPPEDNNGSIEEQVANYEFMRRFFK